MSLKSELIFYSKLCYNNKFVAATDGNLSVRTPKGSILTTSSEICKGKISESSIIEVDLRGRVIKGKKKPSSEFRMHSFIYKSRKDVNAIVHTHPKFATAFASAGIALDKIVLPEVYLKMGYIPLANYATPSTDEVPKSIAKFVKNFNAVFLANHGLVTYAKSLEEAYYLTEKVEQFAEISFYARMLGGEKQLNKNQVSKLNKIKAY
jgi:L-fuculose-phosphate aldolase